MSDIKDMAIALLKQVVKDLEISGDAFTNNSLNIEAKKLIEEYEQNKKHEDLPTIQKYAIGEGYLTNWYQTSVDIAESPVWTDEHLYELNEDFYLIPKRWFEGDIDNGTN